MKLSKTWNSAVFFLLLASGVFLFSCSGRKSKPASYEFTNIRRGNVERTVTSSGNINPVAQVKVLPQMSGKVEKIYVDYNDSVRKGDILAELNTDVLRLQREQQNASVIKARANFELQQINYRNQQALAEKNLISEYELKTSKTTLDNQSADLAVAEANLKEIDTKINQYAYITSPIDGIVLDRKINVGDTVVDSSSNNSSAIFTIAENLREMQIEAVVGELDVSSISKGQAVRFTLESFPGQSFSGIVETLRMIPVVSNNVVSYTVIIKVENHDGALMPGMTCAVEFIVERSENVLLVSNAALRYQPTNLNSGQIADMVFNASLQDMTEDQKKAAIDARNQQQAQSDQNRNTGPTLTQLMAGGGGRMMGGGGGRQGNNQAQGRNTPVAIVYRNMWFFSNDNKLEVMRVQTGITNGTVTELFSDEDLEGKQVILREKINAGN